MLYLLLILALTDDGKRLEGWVRLEAEKYAAVIEKRHHLELEAFAEQMRLKDEKLEGYRWRLLSMEIESKRLQSHVEGMNHETSQLRHDNMKLEALLFEREEELHSLKEQFISQLKSFSCQNTLLTSCLHDPALTHDAIWSKDKSVKRRPKEKEKETETSSVEMAQGKGIDIEEKTPSSKESKNVKLVQSPEKEIDEENDASIDSPIQEEKMSLVEVDTVEKVASSSQSPSNANNSPWRMDLHALGVSYKLKRLKQQLLMLERFTGKSGEDTESNDDGIKGLLSLISLLNKQVGRYQSLQGKIDDICKRLVSLLPTYLKFVTSFCCRNLSGQMLKVFPQIFKLTRAKILKPNLQLLLTLSFEICTVFSMRLVQK